MRILLSLVLAFFLASPALAQFQGPGSQAPGGFQGPGTGMSQAPGGFQGPGTGISQVTVKQAAQMWDDTIVTLTGNIVSKVTGTKDKYIFRDSSGEIRVEIDDKYFYGVNVTPQDTVRITGEVEKDFGKPTEIDVKRLEVLR